MIQLHCPLYAAISYKTRLWLVWAVLFLFCGTEEKYQLQLVKALNVNKQSFFAGDWNIGELEEVGHTPKCTVSV